MAPPVCQEWSVKTTQLWLLDAALTAETAPLTSICVRKWLQFEYFSNNEM